MQRGFSATGEASLHLGATPVRDALLRMLLLFLLLLLLSLVLLFSFSFVLLLRPLLAFMRLLGMRIGGMRRLALWSLGPILLRLIGLHRMLRTQVLRL